MTFHLDLSHIKESSLETRHLSCLIGRDRADCSVLNQCLAKSCLEHRVLLLGWGKCPAGPVTDCGKDLLGKKNRRTVSG